MPNPAELPAVAFAMRYPDDVGLVWASMARVYGGAAAELAGVARPLLCFPTLTERPAFDSPWADRVACDWYDTHSPASRDRVRTVAGEHRVRVVVLMGCLGNAVDLRFLREFGVRTLSYEQDSFPPDTQPWFKRVAKKFLRGGLKLGVHDRYVANAHHQTRFLVRSAGLPASRVVTVVNGVDVERFTPGPRPDPASLGLPATEHHVISVSQARPEKRVDVLIDAAAELVRLRPGVSVTFAHVGGGQCLEEWKAKAAKLGLAERFVFPGSHPDVAPFHRLATVFVHAAERESFGYAVAEAMACGKPVVAVRSAGPAEVIEDGRTGMLVEPGDAAGFARAILGLLEDAGLREKMGAAGRDRAARLYDVRRQSAELAGVIRGLLGS